MRGNETRRRKAGYRAGLLAEAVAAGLLRLKGWRILERRLRTPVGEIDIIAVRGGTVAFVEVKLRRDLQSAVSAPTPHQFRRIEKAARWWLSSRPFLAERTCRFDLVAVNRWLIPVHIPNVHDTSESHGT